ncbi:MAG: hypothetical protein WC146_01705 [Patescibacteria group bacterium]
MKNKIISAVSIGVILQWLSLFFSYRKLPNFFQGNISQPIATGGFPLNIFKYPVPPMGNNWPPVNSWPMFILNLLIWLVIAFSFALLLGKTMKNRKVMAASVIFAIILCLLGTLYIMIKFD